MYRIIGRSAFLLVLVAIAVVPASGHAQSLAFGAAAGMWTGPQMKTLGRDLGERVMLERVVDGIVQLSGDTSGGAATRSSRQ